MRSIHGVAEPLLAAEIPLSRLEAHMTEQKWNLFQLATGRVARSAVSALGDHPKPANGDHLKSGQRIN